MTDRMKYGSDLVVELMKALGIEYVAFNPGSSFRGIHDSLVNYGENNPGILLCAHEEISVSIAQGYAVAAGKPMSAITHDLVGLQHASMAIYNAWCDQAPVLVLGGGGPMDISRRRPWIEWIHTAQVQGNLVRDFVKWDDQPCGDLSVVDSFIRGYRLATSKPCGPVYICLDALWQETELASPVDISYASKLLKSTPLAPDPDAIRKVAGWLAQAENPVIVADRYGPDSKAVDALVELAELTATPVIDLGKRFNFPNTHPMDLTGAKDILIPKADLIIFLDLEDPWGYLHRVNDPKEGKVTPLITPEVKVVDISLRDIATRSWSAAYGKLPNVEINLAADTSLAVPALVEACRKAEKGLGEEYRERRREWLEEKRHQMKREWWEKAASSGGEKPIATEWLAYTAGEVLKDEDWVLGSGNLRGWPRRLWKWDKPYRWGCESGGAGLGNALGVAIGTALANTGKGRLCLNFQADGDFMMTPQALWTAVKSKIPLLVIMYNNRSYYNSEDHSNSVAKNRGRSQETRLIGTAIDEPPVDYAGIARAFGAYGEGPVEDPAKLKPALERALKAVKTTGLPALVDVVCAKMGRRNR